MLRVSLTEVELKKTRLRRSLFEAEKRAFLFECRASEVAIEAIEAFKRGGLPSRATGVLPKCLCQGCSVVQEESGKQSATRNSILMCCL